jgi:hypothetical protein
MIIINSFQNIFKKAKSTDSGVNKLIKKGILNGHMIDEINVTDNA